MKKTNGITRRTILKLGSILGIGSVLPTRELFYDYTDMIRRPISATGELLPVVGLGTYQTFYIGDDQESGMTLSEVLKEVNRLGGSVIDSSPMYASSERVVGDLTSALDFQDNFFYATKVWTNGKEDGIAQMNRSMRYMRRSKMDLIQIHNLKDWKTHVTTLKKWKEQDKIRYWGITHYTDYAHSDLERVIKSERPDFVQFNYSILSRHAEKTLFETCARYGAATIINMPFASGSLFNKVKDKSLPPWAIEFDIESWGQFFLKFIISNPQVTCVIPGTSKPHHAIDNMQAGYGRMPDKEIREKMYEYLKRI